jgi:mannosyltransferase
MSARPTFVAGGPSTSDAPSDGNAARPSRRRLAALPRSPALVVAAVAAAVVSVHLTRRQLWFDEYATWFTSTLPWPQMRRLLGNVDIVHAAYYLPMRGWVAVFGDSVLALRSLSVLGVAVAAGGLTLLGRRMCGTAVGVVAGLLYAVLPVVSRFGQEARSYAWVAAVTVLSTLALLRALERPRWPRWLLYGGSLVLLVHLHAVAALILPAHALLTFAAGRLDPAEAGQVVRHGRDPRGWWRWAVTAVAAGVLTLPLLYEASTQSDQVAWIVADERAVRQYVPNLFGSATVAWVMVPLGLLGAVVLWYTRRAPLPALLAWVLLPPVISYLAYDWARFFLAKYVLFTLPGWALLAAIGLAVPLGGLRRWLLPVDVGVLMAVAVAVVAAAGLGAQAEVRRPRLVGEPDFRAAAGVIDDRFLPGDGIAFAGFEDRGRPRQPLDYYLATARPRDVFAAGPPGSHGWYGVPPCADPAACLGDPARVWLVADGRLDDPVDAMPPAQAALLRGRYAVSTTERLPFVDVMLLVRR